MRRTEFAGLREASRLRRRPDWAAAALAGICAAALMGLAAVAAGAGAGRGASYAARLVGTLLLGRDALSAGTPAGAAWAAGALAHLLLGVGYTALLADLVYRLRDRLAALFGAFFGLALYFLNYHLFTAVFPWFADARGAGNAGLHVLFGAAAAWLYKRFERRRMQPAEKVRA